MMRWTKAATLCAILGVAGADICTEEDSRFDKAVDSRGTITQQCNLVCDAAKSYKSCMKNLCDNSGLVNATNGEPVDVRLRCTSILQATMNRLDAICPTHCSVNCGEIPTDCSPPEGFIIHALKVMAVLGTQHGNTPCPCTLPLACYMMRALCNACAH